MDEKAWIEITKAIKSTDVNTAVDGCARLQAEAGLEDEPQLLEMLHHPDFFVREAAAWPLAELSGPRVLPQLFLAYQRGFDEGHDNDGFTAALLEIPSLHPETKAVLEEMLGDADGVLRENIVWLMEFC